MFSCNASYLYYSRVISSKLCLDCLKVFLIARPKAFEKESQQHQSEDKCNRDIFYTSCWSVHTPLQVGIKFMNILQNGLLINPPKICRRCIFCYGRLKMFRFKWGLFSGICQWGKLIIQDLAHDHPSWNIYWRKLGIYLTFCVFNSIKYPNTSRNVLIIRVLTHRSGSSPETPKHLSNGIRLSSISHNFLSCYSSNPNVHTSLLVYWGFPTGRLSMWQYWFCCLDHGMCQIDGKCCSDGHNYVQTSRKYFTFS